MTRGWHVLWVGVIVAGTVLRVVHLDRVPGINADEAWYGVNVRLLLDGEPVFQRTGVGNILSPFHSGLLIPLELAAGPSFTLLRLPSVFWGVLTLVLVRPLLAKEIGAAAAIVATSWLAVSAAVVAQGRFGWDPSATVLVSLLMTGFALQGRRWRCTMAFLAGFLVHPTNVFLVPVAAIPWIPVVLRSYTQASTPLRRRAALAVAVLTPIAGLAGVVLARRLAHAGFLPSIEMVFERMTSPEAWYATASGVVALFSGLTTATAIAGGAPALVRIVASGSTLLVFGLAVFGFWRTRRERWLSSPHHLALAVIFSVIAFHIVAGPRALQPGVERYAMFLVAPLTVACICGLSAVRYGKPVGSLLTVALALVLATGYFFPLMTRGGDGHNAYRTAASEPKQLAFEFVSAHSAHAQTVAVFAEDWWIYWPLRYLASADRRLQVGILSQEHARWLHPPGSVPQPLPQRPDAIYAVAFAGSALVSDFGQPLFTARDPIGRAILHVFTVPSDSYQRLARR